MVEPQPATGVNADGTELILKSPDGTRWRITVDDTGVISTEEVTE